MFPCLACQACWIKITARPALAPRGLRSCLTRQALPAPPNCNCDLGYLRAILTALAALAGVAHSAVLNVCAVALAAPTFHAPLDNAIDALHG